jgi:hypothetical protein
MVRTKEEWDSIIERERVLIEQFGPAVAAAVLDLDVKQIKHACYKRGVRMVRRHDSSRMSAADKAIRVQQAKDWRAAGCDVAAVPPRVIAHKDTGKFNRTLKIAQPAGVAPNVSIFDTGFQASASVDTSRAKVTIAPTFVDRRFAPDPGHVGMFSLAGIGRDVQTGGAWA